jgi:hypothetical protein
MPTFHAEYDKISKQGENKPISATFSHQEDKSLDFAEKMRNKRLLMPLMPNHA